MNFILKLLKNKLIIKIKNKLIQQFNLIKKKMILIFSFNQLQLQRQINIKYPKNSNKLFKLNKFPKIQF